MDVKVQEKRWFDENQEWFVKLRLDDRKTISHTFKADERADDEELARHVLGYHGYDTKDFELEQAQGDEPEPDIATKK